MVADAAAQLFTKVPRSSYTRSLQEENCGARAKVTQVRLHKQEPVAAMRFCYPEGSLRGKLIIAFEDRSVCSIDVATLSIEDIEDAAADTVAELCEPIKATVLAASAHTQGPGAWLDGTYRFLLRINSASQIEIVQQQGVTDADGLTQPPLVISTTAPVKCLALDHLAGGFAVATSAALIETRQRSSKENRGSSSSFISIWSFSHNRIPVPLMEFMNDKQLEQ